MSKFHCKENFVSVIIPTYNCSQYICEAIDSVLMQTYKDLEIIVIDDGSTDDTLSILKTYENKISIISQVNNGPSSARNLGISKARGDYIAFLDSDDTWLKNKLELQLKVFRDNQNVGFVNCGAFIINKDGSRSDTSLKQQFDKKELLENLLLCNCVGTPSGWIVKRVCLDDVGVFDENLQVGEDWDLGTRICRKYDYLCLDLALIEYRILKSSQSYFGGKNLESELKVLNKMFLQNEFKVAYFTKMKAYSYRYFCAAWAFNISGDLNSAFITIIKGFCLYPLDYFNNKQGGLMIKIILKKILGIGVPVNAITKPVFKVLYNLHVFLRESILWTRRFFYNEPLFRSQCASVGYGLWMEELPYISGRGDIVIGNNVRLSGRSVFGLSSKHYRPDVKIGDNTFIGHVCVFNCAKKIVIGKNCFIASGVRMSDNDGHPLNYEDRRNHLPPNKNDIKDVIIGDDVWIGTDAVILKGVKVGDKAVIASRAVVTKDIPAGAVVAGNPAKIVKQLEFEENF